MENNTQITYKENIAIKSEELSRVFKSSGIKRPFDDLNRLERMIENSDIFITAWHHDKLVGIA